DQAGADNGLRLLSEASIEKGDVEMAESSLNESLLLYEQQGDRVKAGWLVATLAHAAYLAGDTKRALELDREALSLIQASGDKRMIAQCLNNIGFLLILREDHQAAIDYIREGLQLSNDIGDDIHICDMLESVAYLAYRHKHIQRAVTVLGATGDWRHSHNVPRQRGVQRDCDEITEAANAALTRHAVNAALLRGARMTLEQAV